MLLSEHYNRFFFLVIVLFLFASVSWQQCQRDERHERHRQEVQDNLVIRLNKSRRQSMSSGPPCCQLKYPSGKTWTCETAEHRDMRKLCNIRVLCATLETAWRRGELHELTHTGNKKCV